MQNSMILNIVAILCIIAIKKFALILSIINRHTSNCVRVSLLIICLLISRFPPPNTPTQLCHMTNTPTVFVCVCFVVTELVSSNTLLQQAQLA